MLKVKGVIVYPAAIDNVIASFIPRVTGEFHIALDEPPPRVVPPLKLRIERGVETPKSALAELEKEIVKALKERLKFSPAIIWLEPSRLERSTHKTRFIEVAPKGGLSLRAANSHQRTRTKTQQRGHP